MDNKKMLEYLKEIKKTNGIVVSQKWRTIKRLRKDICNYEKRIEDIGNKNLNIETKSLYFMTKVRINDNGHDIHDYKKEIKELNCKTSMLDELISKIEKGEFND